MKKSILAFLALPLMMIAACEEEQTYTNEFEEAEMTLSKETASVAEAGTSDSVEITTEETALDATVNYAYKTWLEATLNGKTIVLKALEDNPTTSPREGTVLVTAGEKGKTVQKTITVTQDGSTPATLTLSAEEVELEKEENSSAEVTFTSNKSVVATSSDPSWCSVAIDGNKITIKALSANTEYTPRYANVEVVAGSGQIIAKKSIKVAQQAPEAVVDIIQLDQDALEFEAVDATVKSVNYTANVALTATVSEGAASWLKVEVDEVTIKVSVLDGNISKAARSATITLTGGSASAKIAVTQKSTIIGMAYGTEGVVFWQNPDNAKEAKIISAKAEKKNWSTTATVTGATSDSADPSVNNGTIKGLMDYATNGYIVKWCEDMGPGWYMPTLTELRHLYKGYNGLSYDECTNDVPANLTDYEKLARKMFEATMKAIGGVAINGQAETANGDSIWSVRESSETQAYYLRFGKKTDGKANKVSASPGRFARCVKVVTIE